MKMEEILAERGGGASLAAPRSANDWEFEERKWPWVTLTWKLVAVTLVLTIHQQFGVMSKLVPALLRNFSLSATFKDFLILYEYNRNYPNNTGDPTF